MIAVDIEYIAETAVDGSVPGERPDVKTTYCEIIQIGAVKLDKDGKEVGTLNLTIKPSFISRIPEWLSKMTGMSETKREAGVTFEEALVKLNQFIGEEKSVWTFSGDWNVFTNSAKKHDLALPFAEFQLVNQGLPSGASPRTVLPLWASKKYVVVTCTKFLIYSYRTLVQQLTTRCTMQGVLHTQCFI